MLRAIASRSPEAAISYSFSASNCFVLPWSDLSDLLSDNRKKSLMLWQAQILTSLSFKVAVQE
jgi:hypothetical protein